MLLLINWKYKSIILDEFNKFITQGESVEECRTGALDAYCFS